MEQPAKKPDNNDKQRHSKSETVLRLNR
jgi:hypothetical protein